MGWITKVLSFIRTERNGDNVSDVKTDPGGGANTTAQHFPPIGDDSFPLVGDYAATIELAGAGREGAVGYVDGVNPPKATAGDKRIYARDASTGITIVDIWLKNDGTAITQNSNATFTVNLDGTISGSNGAGSFALLPNGDFNVNGAVISAAGEMTPAGSVGMSVHVHAQGNDSNGDSQQNTGIPI